MSKPNYRFSTRVSFGDCDPAGIVFYPNILAWLDRTFHDWLWKFGGHDALCKRLGAVGMGLMEVSARFLRPMRNGDDLTIDLAIEEWRGKSVTITYEIRSGENLMATGRETRGLFAQGEAGMIVASLDSLRDVLEDNEE